MTWAERTSPIKVGDQVAYSKAFCQSTGQLTGDTPHARGKVVELQPLGQTMLAVIDWGNPGLPTKVNVKNLSVVRNGQVIERD